MLASALLERLAVEQPANNPTETSNAINRKQHPPRTDTGNDISSPAAR
jgi:hypothetical protein